MEAPALSPDASPIHASCKVPITVGADKEVICRFNETGYHGTMTIVDHLNGVAVVRPHEAKAGDPFIVRGFTPEPAESSCGHSIRIHILGIVTCQFHEDGYHGTFTIDPSYLSGIATVSPLSGDRHTQFTVTGLVEGGGYMIVTGVRASLFSVYLCASHQRRAATNAQINSRAPNGHAPCRNPYTEPSRHAAAKAKINQRLRSSNAYVTSMALTAKRPNQVSAVTVAMGQ